MYICMSMEAFMNYDNSMTYLKRISFIQYMQGALPSQNKDPAR